MKATIVSRATAIASAAAAAAALAVATPALTPRAASPAFASSSISQFPGVDTCDAPSLAQMQAFWTNTPYYNMGIYIGGSLRACGQVDQGLHRDHLIGLSQQDGKDGLLSRMAGIDGFAGDHDFKRAEQAALNSHL